MRACACDVPSPVYFPLLRAINRREGAGPSSTARCVFGSSPMGSRLTSRSTTTDDALDHQLAAKKATKAAYYAEKKERRETKRAVKKAQKAARRNSKGELAPGAVATAEDDGKDAKEFWSGTGDAPPTADVDSPPTGASVYYTQSTGRCRSLSVLCLNTRSTRVLPRCCHSTLIDHLHNTRIVVRFP
jgi:hypothetical protein